MKKIISIFLLISICAKAYGQPVAPEEALKAAYIYHFINFIQWEDNLNSYYICVPDDNSLKEALETTLKGKIINNRSILILHQAQSCHVLISDNPPLSQNTLTIGPLDKGALLEFQRKDNKLKFAVNLEKVKKSKIKMSSQLLKLAILESNS